MFPLIAVLCRPSSIVLPPGTSWGLSSLCGAASLCSFCHRHASAYSFASFHVSQQCVLTSGVHCEGRRLVPGGTGCFAAQRGRRGLLSAALLVALWPSRVSPVSLLEVRHLFGKCPVCSCSVGYAEVPKSARKQGWGLLDMMDNVCKLGRGKSFLWLFSLSGYFTGRVGDEHRTNDNKSTREKSLAC